MNAVSIPYVLVVEDDRDLGDVICENLLAEGCRVDVARSGEDALELARSHPYDLVLLDVMLPGVDGFSICERYAGASADVGSDVFVSVSRVRTDGTAELALERSALYDDMSDPEAVLARLKPDR